jgi:hypothetical protein
MLHTSNSNTWEAEAGGLKFQGQLGIHSKTRYQKIKQNSRQAKKGIVKFNDSGCLPQE